MVKDLEMEVKNLRRLEVWAVEIIVCVVYIDKLPCGWGKMVQDHVD